MKTKKSAPATTGNRPPSEDELEQIEAASVQLQRLRKPRTKVEMEGDLLASPHSDRVGHLLTLLEALGTRSQDFLNVNLGALEAATRQRGAGRGDSAVELNAAIAIVQAIAPQNELEAALAVQMAGTHALATEMLWRTKLTDGIDHLHLYGNLAIKLERTFTMQMEALGRFRRGGEQTVKHVHVSEGGQAIVGDVHNHPGGGSNLISEEQCDATAQPTGDCPALPRSDPAGDGMPVPSRARKAKVPNARRE